MWTSLLVAFSSISLSVPYLSQTEALCGGAAAAMVFRYWGDAHADIEPFAALVDKRAGGIADGVLVKAIEDRGWRALRFAGSLDALTEQLEKGRPVVILVADRGTLNHFLVVTGIEPDAIVVHDPTWGPSRRIRVSDLMRVWEPTNFWSLLVLPGDAGPPIVAERAQIPAIDVVPSLCERLLASAIDQAAGRPAAEAYEIIDRVRRECADDSGPLRELAGVRFAEGRWHDAADLAGAALAKNPTDRYAWEVLASSRYMLDDLAGSLRAWNQIGKPRINLLHVDGLTHTRFQTIATVIGLKPNMVLSERAFRLAERRLDDLPNRAAAGLRVRPEPDGYVTVRATLVERTLAPKGVVAWTAAALRAGINREVGTTIPGAAGEADVWTAGWRWWGGRPRVTIGYGAPRLRGVVHVEASWDSERYASTLEQARTHGALTLSKWLTPDMRYTVTTGIDSWRGAFTGRTAFTGGALERRWQADRWSLSGSATAWMPLGMSAGFQTGGVRAAFRSTRAAADWVYLGDIGVSRATRSAPLSVWPRAGEGQSGDVLLRAHPLLNDGGIDLDERAMLGRTLAYAHGEVQRWLGPALPVRFGLAAFADLAHASHRRAPATPGRAQLDLGGGIRIRIPGSQGTLRVDVAHGFRDDADALTVGWQF